MARDNGTAAAAHPFRRCCGPDEIEQVTFGDRLPGDVRRGGRRFTEQRGRARDHADADPIGDVVAELAKALP